MLCCTAVDSNDDDDDDEKDYLSESPGVKLIGSSLVKQQIV